MINPDIWNGWEKKRTTGRRRSKIKKEKKKKEGSRRMGKARDARTYAAHDETMPERQRDRDRKREEEKTIATIKRSSVSSRPCYPGCAAV